MILAAGRGERMRPLTDHCPKPLLPVCGQTLLDRHLEGLARAGFTDVVINIAWLGAQIVAHCRAHDFGLRLRFSDEGASALETGGGIRHALALLGDDAFAVVNGDIHTDYPLERLHDAARAMRSTDQAHLVLVPNPPHRPDGDFGFRDGRLHARDGERLTFSGIGLYRPSLFAAQPDRAFPLAPLLREAIARDAVGGEQYDGHWSDVGTPARLAALESALGCAPPAGGS